MKLNPFKKDPVKKEQTRLLKETEARFTDRLKEIEKIQDPAERIAKYEAISQELQGFYKENGKPAIMNFDNEAAAVSGGVGGIVGGVGGLMGGGIAALALIPITVAAPIAVPVIIAATVGGAATGAALPIGTAGLLGGINKRKKLREKYGTIRNARSVYKLQQEVAEKIKSDKATVKAIADNAKLRERFNETYNGVTKAEAETVAKPVTVSKQMKP